MARLIQVAPPQDYIQEIPGQNSFVRFTVEGSSFEITDIPLLTGREFNQFQSVSRKGAEELVKQYPDWWRIEE